MQSVRFLSVMLTIALALGSITAARSFATGTPLSLQVEPATVRQQEHSRTVKVIATVVLQDPAPHVFVCRLRSQEAAKISFPTIIFHPGDVRATSEGVVHWKSV